MIKTANNVSGKSLRLLLKWGKTCIKMTKPVVLERRENACMACPNLKDPQNLLQKIMPVAETNHSMGHRTGKKVCDLCGCNVSKKMRLPSEFCPDLHPENHGETRWGEPVPAFREAG